MLHALVIHPASTCPAVSGITVEARRPRPGHLVLRYAVTGQIGALALPAAAAPARTDGLWQHSCFEAFLRAAPEAGYHELNFAPSMQWAAYRFTGYRSGMQPAHEIAAPRFEIAAAGESYVLQAALDLPGLPADAPWRLGLSAVIEEVSGKTSYWALAHPPGKADFHHADSFALELPAAW